jgi:hypothetical protein
MVIDIEKRRADRLRVMNEIYEAANGSRFTQVPGPWLLEHMGMPADELADVCAYLASEHLIEGDKTSWGSLVPYFLRLTHRGITEMERSHSEPERPTVHFPPMISIVHIEGDNVGSPIQAGSPGAQQSVSMEDLNLDRVREIVTELVARAPSMELPEDEAAQLQADLATVTAQVNSPRPNHRTIREHLLSMKAILENTAGGVAAGGLLELFQHIHL